jgi:ATP-dependent exoDNAse (exonuclease V) beta subunit
LAGLPQAGTESDDADKQFYDYVCTESKERDKAEVCRLFYVAATRAKNTLHLLGNLKSKKDGVCDPSGGFLRLLHKAGQCKAEFDAVWERQQRAKSNQQSLFLQSAPRTKLLRLPPSWSMPVPAPSVPGRREYIRDTPSTHEPSYQWVSETGRHVGIIVHDMLRRIAEEGAEHWTAARVKALSAFAERELRAVGVPAAERADAVARVIEAVSNVVESSRGRWLLSSHHDAHCEYAVGGVVGGRLESARIDRTFVENGVRWIIDYKTSSHEGGGLDRFLREQKRRYQSQLDLYGRLFAQAGAQQVAIGLYFPLLNEWISWTLEPAEAALPVV